MSTATRHSAVDHAARGDSSRVRVAHNGADRLLLIPRGDENTERNVPTHDLPQPRLQSRPHTARIGELQSSEPTIDGVRQRSQARRPRAGDADRRSSQPRRRLAITNASHCENRGTRRGHCSHIHLTRHRPAELVRAAVSPTRLGALVLPCGQVSPSTARQSRSQGTRSHAQPAVSALTTRDVTQRPVATTPVAALIEGMGWSPSLRRKDRHSSDVRRILPPDSQPLSGATTRQQRGARFLRIDVRSPPSRRLRPSHRRGRSPLRHCRLGSQATYHRAPNASAAAVLSSTVGVSAPCQASCQCGRNELCSEQRARLAGRSSRRGTLRPHSSPGRDRYRGRTRPSVSIVVSQGYVQVTHSATSPLALMYRLST